MADVLPMGGFYQFGYLSREIEAAAKALRDRFGVTHLRRKESAMMATLHAWTGGTMIEVIVPGPEAPPLYTEGLHTKGLPDQSGALLLHHLGRRIADETGWQSMERAVAANGLDMPMSGSVMDGQLRYAYVDTRAMLGIYSEYVCLSGDALKIYDDVPQNG